VFIIIYGILSRENRGMITILKHEGVFMNITFLVLNLQQQQNINHEKSKKKWFRGRVSENYMLSMGGRKIINLPYVEEKNDTDTQKKPL